MNKSLFIFNIDNVIDIITNSSSELFTFKMDNGNILSNLLESFDPNFYEKFNAPVLLRDSSDSVFISYISTILPYIISAEDKNKFYLPKGIAFEDIYSYDLDDGLEYFVRTYGCHNPNWGKHRCILQEWLDPTNNIWLLYNDDDCILDYELKDKLKQISTYERY